jgi:hypothetical protein
MSITANVFFTVPSDAGFPTTETGGLLLVTLCLTCIKSTDPKASPEGNVRGGVPTDRQKRCETVAHGPGPKSYNFIAVFSPEDVAQIRAEIERLEEARTRLRCRISLR